MLIQDILNAPIVSTGDINSLFTENVFPFYLGECNIPDDLTVNYIDEDETIGYLVYLDKPFMVINGFSMKIINFDIWLVLVLKLHRSDRSSVTVASLTDII